MIESTMPTITPANTPKVSTAAIAATAIQKSNRFTRKRRRSAGTSIIPSAMALLATSAPTFPDKSYLDEEDFGRTILAMGTSLLGWTQEIFTRGIFADERPSSA
jgi:hypothetical protein